MSENTFDIESVRQIEALSQAPGGLAECKRLGFVFTDEKGIMSLSVAGLGYLLFVKARDITNVAEASRPAINAPTRRNPDDLSRGLKPSLRQVFLRQNLTTFKVATNG